MLLLLLAQLGQGWLVEELEAQLLQSIDRLDRGEGVDGKEMIRRLRKRIAGARGNG